MTKKTIQQLLDERILILDGGMGTMIQGFKLTEADYRGEQFANFTGALKGNNDLLNITRPEVIRAGDQEREAKESDIRELKINSLDRKSVV